MLVGEVKGKPGAAFAVLGTVKLEAGGACLRFRGRGQTSTTSSQSTRPKVTVSAITRRDPTEELILRARAV